MNEQKQYVCAELVNKDFGKRLASIRRSKNFTQLELGRRVALSRASISNLESGIQNVQMYQVFDFALALNTPVDEFVPLLRDVVMHQDDDAAPDQIFLRISKLQLAESNPLGANNNNEDA